MTFELCGKKRKFSEQVRLIPVGVDLNLIFASEILLQRKKTKKSQFQKGMYSVNLIFTEMLSVFATVGRETNKRET